MKVKADRHQKLISWAPIDVLYIHKVWSQSDKIYSKIKGFVDFHVWPSGDLDLWPWPLWLSLTIDRPQVYLDKYYGEVWLRNEEVKFCVKKHLFRHCDVIWRHIAKILTDPESTHQYLQFEVLHDLVPAICKFDLGVIFFGPGPKSRGQNRSPPKTNQLSAWP